MGVACTDLCKCCECKNHKNDDICGLGKRAHCAHDEGPRAFEYDYNRVNNQLKSRSGVDRMAPRQLFSTPSRSRNR